MVGTTHDEFAYNQENDVLVEYYADWCPHCKDLAPIYDQLATDVSNIPTLKIAKMLSTDNETAYYHPAGYPNIMFYPAGAAFGTKPVYCASRDAEGIRSFLKANSTVYKNATSQTDL